MVVEELLITRLTQLGAERQSVRFADKQCRMSARGAIELDEITRPEILDPASLEGIISLSLG